MMTPQHQRVFDAMKDGRFRTLPQIADATGDPASSINARLRDFRKPDFGSHTVNRRYEGTGLHSYQLIVNRREKAA